MTAERAHRLRLLADKRARYAHELACGLELSAFSFQLSAFSFRLATWNLKLPFVFPLGACNLQLSAFNEAKHGLSDEAVAAAKTAQERVMESVWDNDEDTVWDEW